MALAIHNRQPDDYGSLINKRGAKAENVANGQEMAVRGLLTAAKADAAATIA